MITVAGEALIDLVVDRDGCIRARPGGGPFNTARTIGRLGLAPAFLGRLSRDGFGRLLSASLDSDGVLLSVPELVDARSTIAVVEVDSDGAAQYGFYLAGTASAVLDFTQLAAALPSHVTTLHAGTLALTMSMCRPLRSWTRSARATRSAARSSPGGSATNSPSTI
jgi:fructokinase